MKWFGEDEENGDTYTDVAQAAHAPRGGRPETNTPAYPTYYKRVRPALAVFSGVEKWRFKSVGEGFLGLATKWRIVSCESDSEPSAVSSCEPRSESRGLSHTLELLCQPGLWRS